MRRMSFAMTTDAVRNRTKTVTRRLGWTFLKPGDRLLAVDKIRTKNAEKLAVIEVVDVRREPLYAIANELGDPTAAEGFPDLTIVEFCTIFRQSMKCDAGVDVTRIEFRYIDEPEVAA